MKSVTFFSFLCCLLLAGCTKRERINPLDPENPRTQGRPEAPLLYSVLDTVVLSWREYSFSDLDSIRIFRKIEGEGEFELLRSVAHQQSEVRDFPVPYEKRHWYSISLNAREYESLRSEAAGIRPGPTFLWASDIERGQIVRYTHDGAHEVFRSQPLFLEPIDIALDTLNQVIWVADAIASEILRVDFSGRIGLSLRGIKRIYQLRLDPADQSLLVLSRLDSTLARYATDGQEIMQVRGLNRPVALRVHAADRSLFVLEKSRRRIVHLSAAGDSIGILQGFSAPYDLAIDSKANLLWVADSASVLRIDLRDGSRTAIDGFDMAYRVAVEPSSGTCWLIEWSPEREKSAVVQVSRDAQIQFRLGGFTDPRSLAVNSYNGNCFVAETLAGTLSEVSVRGELLSRTATRGGLIDLAVQPAPAPR